METDGGTDHSPSPPSQFLTSSCPELPTRRKTQHNARGVFYPYSVLRSEYPEDIDLTKKELYLTDQDFLGVFGTSKEVGRVHHCAA